MSNQVQNAFHLKSLKNATDLERRGLLIGSMAINEIVSFSSEEQLDVLCWQVQRQRPKPKEGRG